VSVFEECAVQPSLRSLLAMFAFALWDAANNELTLARDRFGRNPCSTSSLENGALVFGTEIKALRAFARFRNDIDRRASECLVN
jgi:asparagine synthase (glutamine-hydrolysing)